MLQQARADSVTSLLSLVISLPAAVSNTNKKLCQFSGSGEHSEGWEGQGLHAPSLTFLIGFPQQKHPKKPHEQGKGHLVIKSNGLIRFIKIQTGQRDSAYATARG